MLKRNAHPCPHCKTPTPWEGNPHRPFCSARCRQIDLGHWAMESYRIPGEPVAPDDAAAETEAAAADTPASPHLRIIR